MGIRFDSRQGQFVASQQDMADLQATLRRIGNAREQDEHRAIATTILGPIEQVAAYEEWTNLFFADRSVGENEQIRIAHNKPSMIAMFTSANGEVLFTRPGRRYSTVDFSMVDCGLEVGWDDLRTAGWNILERKVMEAGEALARKRDALGMAVLDAAVAIPAGHLVPVGGGVLTKVATDGIFKAAAAAGWKIDRVAINSGTIMDMTNWTVPATNMWAYSLGEGKGDEMRSQGYVANYGGATWYAKPSVPALSVYFAASPDKLAAQRFLRGDIRTASDINIVKRIDLHTWDQELGYFLGNPYAIWKVTL